jgi:hypothetical protein
VSSAADKEQSLKDATRTAKQEAERLQSLVLQTTKEKDEVQIESNRMRTELNSVQNRKQHYEKELDHLRVKNEDM